MNNLRQLLAAIAALTLLFSVVSSANPNYFAGYSAFADDDEDYEDENSGSSNYDDEEHDDSDRHDSDDKSEGEYTVTAKFGTSSKVALEIDDEIEGDERNTRSVEADLEIETENEDLDDGDLRVSLECEKPEFKKAFDSSFKVDDGKGKFEQEFLLVNGTTYENCVVAIGSLKVDLPKFTVAVAADKEDDDEGSDDDDEREKDDEDNGRGHDNEASIEIDDGKVEIEVETDVSLEDGIYDAQFICEEPRLEMNIEDSLTVKEGHGEFEAELELADGAYKGCKLESEDKVVATFDGFAVRQGQDDDDDDDVDDDREVDEKRKEKRKSIVSKIRADDEHRKRISANPASTGDYRPGWNYTLVADGVGTPRGDSDLDELLEGTITPEAIMEETQVSVEMDMGVWKSNRALILFSIPDGTVEVDDKKYTVELGYALYSVNHNAMRIGAFVSDEDGNIYKLKLRGSADAEDAEFPTESGESIDMVFEGNSGPARNSFSGWELDLKGTIEAE